MKTVNSLSIITLRSFLFVLFFAVSVLVTTANEPLSLEHSDNRQFTMFQDSQNLNRANSFASNQDSSNYGFDGSQRLNNYSSLSADYGLFDFNNLFIKDTFGLDNLLLLVPPTVSSISPSLPTPSSIDQNVTVFGGNFVSGLTVTITFPSGGTGTLSGTQIQNVSSSSFVMRVTLNATGTWCIRVRNPNGEQSNQFCFNVAAAQSPSISSVSPSNPTVSNTDQNVQVNGSNFQSGLTVTVFFHGGGSGTLSGSQIQNVTSTSFRMVVTLNIVGTYGIRVNNPNGLQSNTFNFATQAAIPTISSISPSGVCAQPGDRNFTVSGSNFQSGLTVTVTLPGGGTVTLSGSQIQNVTSSSFTMTATLNIVGTYNFRVNNPNGTQSSNFSYATQNCNPIISSISPSNPVASSSDQSVNVSGSNFQSGLTITVFIPGGGTATLSGSQIQNVTSTSFTMIITLNVAGNYGIRVNNPNGLQSNTFNFTTQNPTPNISSINPSSPCVSSNNQNVTVNGTNFQSGLTVTIFIPGGNNVTLSGSQIQSVTATSFIMVVTLNIQGTYGIRINNPSGIQSSTFNFSTQYCATITSTSPASPTVSNSDQNVAVGGIGFQSGLTVTVIIPNGGGTVTLSGAQVQNVTSTSFTMIVTLNIVGTYGIRVNNPNGNQSNIFNFTTQVAPPAITSVSPSSPCVRTGDQSVVVNGSSFQSGLTVSVTFPNGGTGTLSGSQIQNVTATSFTMIITLADPGTYSIRVINPSGAQSSPFTFSTQNCLSVSGINPSSPTQSNADQDVIVSGNGFTAGLTVIVTFPGGGTATLSGSQILNVTSTSFTMRITLSTSGTWGMKVRNLNGDLSNIHSFTVQLPTPPSVSSINPASPTASSVDQNVIVNGTNFQQGLTVTVVFPSGGTGTLSGTQIQNVTSTSFTMRITLGAAGSWNMRVNNPNGSQSNSIPFTVQSNVQSPSIFSINPASPIVRSTDQDVVVSGSNFQQNLVVDITFPDGSGTTLSGAQIQNVTATSFIMRATLSATGNWTIKVRNPDSGQSSVFGFSVLNGTNAVINSINPAIPATNGADQTVIVNGSNFQHGLRVNVTFPNGGVATLQGSGQIQDVSANSFLMRITLNAAGAWNIRVLNPDNSQSQQFAFNVQASGPLPADLPTSVLSPVIGALRVTSTNEHNPDGKWEFNQHKMGYHSPTGGISLSNDTNAWDVNLYTSTSGNVDAGKTVFAVADGQVVSYVGTLPGGGPGAVLIAHPNAANPVWFSGYLHMTNVRVALNQIVNATTIIGEIGKIGADADHLHFVVYSGQNTRGNLQSFNIPITERSASTTNLPTINSIVPDHVTQSIESQTLVISGNNFQPNSIIELQDPNGQYFTITPDTTSVVDNARITQITSTSITARVPFAFDGTYTVTVINRPSNLTNITSSSFSFPASANYEVISSPNFMNDTPVVLIPGIMGSRLGKKLIGNIYDEIFPSTPFNAKHSYLRNDIGNGNPIGDRPIAATDIFRDYFGGIINGTNLYGTLIDTLTGPYSGYKLYKVTNPNQRTLAGCDTNQRNANFFIFPYDWRGSNEQSARDLKEFIDCIKRIRDPNNTNPNFKVNVIAHSMGGIVARRYILEGIYGTTQNYDPKIKILVTLGTPWLGAPKFVNVLTTGEHESINKLMTKGFVKDIARYMPGAHELIPSPAYTNNLRDSNLGDFPFGENGWDYDGRNGIKRIYSFDELEWIMNRYNPPNTNILPGTNTRNFHEKQYSGRRLQDDWSGDQTGVTYYNFIGRCLSNQGINNTVGSIVATKEWYKDFLGIWRERNNLVPHMARGDCTVPEISSMRQSNNGNYLGPAIPKVFLNVEHGGFPNSLRVIDCIRRLFVGGSLSNCSNAPSDFNEAVNANQLIDEPVYNLKVLGSPMVLISDSFGNTTNPLSTSVDEGVSTITTSVTGDEILNSVVPLDQSYKVIMQTSASPLVITITKKEGQNTTLAIRYLDLIIPPGVTAQLELKPQGVTNLVYDSNGDGTFDTQVNPAITATGTQAQDIEPPKIVVNETVQNGASQIVLEATDSGTGVQRIMYSVDGTTFQQYSTPVTLNTAQTPTIYVFADDNVFNRSSVVMHNLTASSSGFSLTGPLVAVPGSQITASWSVPNGRPESDWVGLFKVNGLNSQFIEKKYTKGQSSGSLNFTLPNQSGLYQFRYLLEDGFTSVADSNNINVTSNRRSQFDFDGDGRADISVFRPSAASWYLSYSSNNAFIAVQFGASGDLIAPADFDGDGKTDISVFRPTDGGWYRLNSSNNTFTPAQFGTNGDLPVPGDFDGDGRADLTVYRPSAGSWYRINSSNNQFVAAQFGVAEDKPLVGDFDGDGKSDLTVFRPSNGTWYRINSATDTFSPAQFGATGDLPVAADYDGDGKTDLAVYRPSVGDWYIINSSNSSFTGIHFGITEDKPAPADFDGDGKSDLVVFRPSTGTWYLLRTTAGFTGVQFGATGDIPTPNAFVRGN
jgi:pimeloyl-ACP methyl ester carboxylesterase